MNIFWMSGLHPATLLRTLVVAVSTTQQNLLKDARGRILRKKEKEKIKLWEKSSLQVMQLRELWDMGWMYFLNFIYLFIYLFIFFFLPLHLNLSLIWQKGALEK